VSIYVKKSGGRVEADEIVRECPHCRAHAQMLPAAIPDYDAIAGTRGEQVGAVFVCAACREPRFAKLSIRSIDAERAELSSNPVEVERPKERFALAYLPSPVERMFSEALSCYAADCHNAFASMCRRTISAAMHAGGSQTRAKLYELFREITELGDLDPDTIRTLETVLFELDGTEPELRADQAAVLIEIVKDMLYQCFVRAAKLKAALRMRRYFAGGADDKVTPFGRDDRRAESA
jgi:SpoVK/Ycf46/Vps4 family AAA+-type ATPase